MHIYIPKAHLQVLFYTHFEPCNEMFFMRVLWQCNVRPVKTQYFVTI